MELNWSFVFGITLPSGFDKPYTGSEDETIRIRDCQAGQCIGVINLGGEVMSSSKLTSVPALTGIAEKLQEAVRKGVLILQESFRKLNLKEQQLRYVRFLSIAVTISVHLEALFPNLTFPNIISQTSSERSLDSHAFKMQQRVLLFFMKQNTGYRLRLCGVPCEAAVQDFPIAPDEIVKLGLMKLFASSMLKLTESLSVRVEPSKAKDHLLSTFMKYMQIAVLTRKEDTISSVQLGQFKQDGTREARFQGTLEEKKDKVLSI
uniref:Uncharacterized protein n=1 Tax=Vitis vinifera TaxID=29760 RepID=A5B7D4_VITVI|nr:hypothetical protein VITISV_012683 [Vitis vinifera]